MLKDIQTYKKKLIKVLNSKAFNTVQNLVKDIQKTKSTNNKIYICGNGGSAANAMHIANDLTYGAGMVSGKGFNIEALPANTSVITCLANDIGYENIYSEQLRVKGSRGDILIVLSGSGNSKNILNVLKIAKKIGIKSYAILGYDGGKAKKLADIALHFKVNDMQIAEDIQIIISHLLMKLLNKKNSK
jgi:D-sedoheptulose 7-phosphate isomerase